MSVGKDSILRAANADAKKTEVKVETKPAEEVKAPAKAEAAPAAKKAPTKKTAAKKTNYSQKNNKKSSGEESSEDIRSHTTEFRRAGESICEGRAAGNSEWSGSYQRRTSDLSSVIRSTFLSEFAGWIF